MARALLRALWEVAVNVRQYCPRCRKVHWVYRQAAPAPTGWTRGEVAELAAGVVILLAIYIGIPWLAFLAVVQP